MFWKAESNGVNNVMRRVLFLYPFRSLQLLLYSCTQETFNLEYAMTIHVAVKETSLKKQKINKRSSETQKDGNPLASFKR
jgi:hypothetical protein